MRGESELVLGRWASQPNRSRLLYAGDVLCQFQRLGPPASLSFVVGPTSMRWQIPPALRTELGPKFVPMQRVVPVTTEAVSDVEAGVRLYEHLDGATISPQLWYLRRRERPNQAVLVPR
jgi:hypothetical protein